MLLRICNFIFRSGNFSMMKIYFSKFFNDYIFVIGGQPYLIDSRPTLFNGGMTLSEVWPEHLDSARMRKKEKDKEVIFICSVKDN